MPRSSATLEPDETAEEAPQPRSQRARVMSQREADRLHGDLASLIQDAGDYLDWGLTHANRAGAESAVWAFDDDEASKLADVWLSRARKSAAAAASVRYVLSQWAYVQVAMLLGGRFVETVTFVAENGGLVAPGFVSQRMRFAGRAASAPPTPNAAGSNGAGGRQRATPGAGAQAVMAAVATAAAQASQQPEPQATQGATAAQSGATPTRDYAQAEEAQRAHAARVASLRDGAGTAEESVAASLPPDAPESAAAPDPLETLDAVEEASA